MRLLYNLPCLGRVGSHQVGAGANRVSVGPNTDAIAESYDI